MRLVITCDCGVTNVAEVAAAGRLGMDVVVTDHHLPGAVLPAASAVVDPHRADCGYPDQDLTGAGLSLPAGDGAPCPARASRPRTSPPSPPSAPSPTWRP